MCFGCSNKQVFAEPCTLSETRLRKGNLYLHYRRVNRNKGRPCQLRYEHHALNYSALIREQTLFGQHTVSSNEFEKTENAGKCAPPCYTLACYDSFGPALDAVKVTPREGEDVTAEELWRVLNSPAPVSREDSPWH